MSYEVVFAPTARREMSAVPERIIPAIIEFVFGDLAANPRRVGKPLERELAGSFSARRGSYRILYDIDDETNWALILGTRPRGEHACRLPRCTRSDRW